MSKANDTLQSVICAGQRLSNIAFNLKQSSEINNEWRVSMYEAQEAWDEALREFHEFRRTKKVVHPKRKEECAT